MRSKTKSILFAVLISSILLLCQMAEIQGQDNNRPATGGGSSSKTKAQAEEMLQRGITYKDPIDSSSATSKNSQSENSNSPSLRETLDWLNQKISAHAALGLFNIQGGSREIFSGFKLMEVEGSITTWVNEGVIQNDARDSYKYILKLVLSDLDPSSVKVEAVDGHRAKDPRFLSDFGSWKVTINTTDNKESPEIILDHEKKRFIGYVKVIFYFRDKDIAERVGKAFRHAIKLSGGKESKPEPF